MSSMARRRGASAALEAAAAAAGRAGRAFGSVSRASLSSAQADPSREPSSQLPPLPAEESVARHAGRVLDAARAHKGGWAVTDALTKQATGDPLLKTQVRTWRAPAEAARQRARDLPSGLWRRAGGI